MSSLKDLLVAAAGRALGVLGRPALWARRRQPRSEDWRRLAERASLEVVESSPRGVVARLGGLTVRVPAMTFTWPDVPGVAVMALPRKRARVPTRGTGDGTFDRSFDLQGPDATVRALLDYQTRDDLCALLEVLRGEALALPGRIARRLAKSGQGLVGAADVAARLAENTRREPCAKARLANLESLLAAFPGEAVTLELTRALFADPDDRVRFSAASSLPAKGRTALLALARFDNATEDSSLRALHQLRGSLSRAEIRSGLEHVCQQVGAAGRWAVAGAWMDLFGAATDPEDTRLVAEVLVGWLGRLSASDVTAIDEEVRHLDAEIATLRKWLASNSDAESAARLEELRTRKHNLVARHGIPVAAALVRALRYAPHGHGREEALRAALKGPREVRVAAADVLGGSPGRLSLAGAEAGQVSLAGEDRRGEVSLEADEEAHRS